MPQPDRMPRSQRLTPPDQRGQRVIAEHAGLWNIPGGGLDDVVRHNARPDRSRADTGGGPAAITRSVFLPVSYDRQDITCTAIGEALAGRLRSYRARPVDSLPGCVPFAVPCRPRTRISVNLRSRSGRILCQEPPPQLLPPPPQLEPLPPPQPELLPPPQPEPLPPPQLPPW